MPISVDKPVLHCLKKLRQQEARKEEEESWQAAEAARQAYEHSQMEADARSNRKLWIGLTSFIILCLCALAVWYMVLIN
ncbi:MAG: hypothetical protein ACE5EQ_09040 [Phycisphaerae bacterium]